MLEFAAMELIPQSQQEPQDNYAEYSDALHEILSDDAKFAKQLNRLPSAKERKSRFLGAMQEAFELVGGVPRLALWADRNYGQFMKLMGRTLPTMVSNMQINAKGPVQIVSALPPTSLDERPEPIDVTPDRT